MFVKLSRSKEGNAILANVGLSDDGYAFKVVNVSGKIIHSVHLSQDDYCQRRSEVVELKPRESLTYFAKDGLCSQYDAKWQIVFGSNKDSAATCDFMTHSKGVYNTMGQPAVRIQVDYSASKDFWQVHYVGGVPHQNNLNSSGDVCNP